MNKLWIITILLLLPVFVSAEAISDVQVEGGTKTYSIGGTNHEVSVVYVSDAALGSASHAKIAIDGLLTESLFAGQSQTLSNGLRVTITEVMINAGEGVVWYSIDSAPIPTPTQRSVVTGTLREGQHQTYALEGVEYEVTAVYISDANSATRNAARIAVNGEMTIALQAGAGTVLSNGLLVSVKDVYVGGDSRYVTFTLQRSATPYQPDPMVPGSIKDTLRLGETKTYTLNGVDYELTLVFLSETVAGHRGAAKFSLNGEITDALEVSGNEALAGGAVLLTVRDILSNADGGAASFELRAGRFPYMPPQQEGIADTMTEGETKTYTLDGRDYEVTLVYVSDFTSGKTEAKFSVNGELTEALRQGIGDTAAGAKILVREVLVHQRDGMVAFTLSAVQITPPQPTGGAFSLDSGASRTFTINGLDYEIALVGVNRPYAGDDRWSAKIKVNGQEARVFQGINTIGTLRLVVTNIGSTVASGSGSVAGWIEFEQPTVTAVRVRNGNYIIVVGKYAPTDDVLTSVDIAKRLQDKGRIGSSGIAVLDEQFQQRYRAIPDDAIIFLIRGRTVHIIVGETAPTEIVTGATDIQQYLQQKGYAVKVVISKDASMRLFDPQRPPSGGPVPPTTNDPDPWDPPGEDPDDSDGPWNQPPSCDNGCFVNDRCLPIGTRIANGGAQYCSIEGQMKVQVADGSSCQNSYECISNQCLNAVCMSLEKEVRETKSMMQGFISWWRSIFG